MKAWAQRPGHGWDVDGLSLHFYSGGPAGVLQSPSTDFGEKDYAGALKSTLQMEDLIRIHSAIMDRYDPGKKVGLMVDEWGLWATPLKGTNFMFMRQQGSLRDAVVAALNLNIFARHADRVRMANIAQMVNVIHSLILTDGPRMVKTPTYYVYRMYAPFQDATALPIKFDPGVYSFGKGTLPQVDGIAARGKDGKIWVELTNLDPNKAVDLVVDAPGVNAGSAVGETLTADRVDAVNTFDHPDTVSPRPVSVRAGAGGLSFHLSPKSVTVVQLEP